MLPTCHRTIAKYPPVAGRRLIGSWEAVVGVGRLQDGDLTSTNSRAPECKSEASTIQKSRNGVPNSTRANQKLTLRIAELRWRLWALALWGCRLVFFLAVALAGWGHFIVRKFADNVWWKIKIQVKLQFIIYYYYYFYYYFQTVCSKIRLQFTCIVGIEIEIKFSYIVKVMFMSSWDSN